MEIQAELERTGESRASLTDPDSRAMAMHPKVGVGYNAQVAVDAKHKLIVEREVTNRVKINPRTTIKFPEVLVPETVSVPLAEVSYPPDF